MTASRRLAPLPLLLIPWSVQAQSDPTDLTRPIVAGDPGCVSHGPTPGAAGPASGSRIPGPQRYPAAARSWRPDSGPAVPGAIAPTPIQEGERKRPGNARRLPLFRGAALA